jgi:tRNA (guanine-N7-)-methyltransferase
LRSKGIETYKALIADRREQLRILFQKVLPDEGRFVWEIGSGHGHFLTAYATAHPSDRCIGIDIAPERVARAERKQARAHLGNLHFILADADDFLAALPRGRRASAIFILFPDPWPKRRHHKNRLMKPEFLAAAAAAADKGAHLYFRTDYEPYFAEARLVVGADPSWRLLPTAPLPIEEPTVFQKRAPRHFTLVAARR